MSACQGKIRVLAVIEAGGLPVRTGVAPTAVRVTLRGRPKLPLVDIRVASLALCGRSTEGDELASARHLRFVAIGTGCRAVLTGEREPRCAVIEGTGFLPAANRVARLARGKFRFR